MNTTRRYPRTLGEAFGGADYACAIERPGRSIHAVSLIAFASLLALFLTACAVGVLS